MSFCANCGDSAESQQETFGTITINGIGSVAVKDNDSLVAAEAFLNIIRKRVKEMEEQEENQIKMFDGEDKK
jgi:hypothetical protein